MRKAEHQPSVYIVYPAALFDGWEVVEDHRDAEPAFFDTREEATDYARAQAATVGGAYIKVENWYGDTEAVWEITSQTERSFASVVS